MFILHSSNKTENLLEHLAIVLKTAPLSSPFAEELFLIQSQGMERWLSQQLSLHFKVWGNFRYLFPNKFFNSLADAINPNIYSQGFERQQLLWRFEGLLRETQDESFNALQHFLAGEQLDVKRYQLALQLSRIFDQYQMLRPDWLAVWQQGKTVYGSENELWQARLWQALSAELGLSHRGERWQQIIRQLKEAAPEGLAGFLPERISVFGINSMPPLLLSFLEALSGHCQVHLYLLNPVQDYWADMPSKRLLVQLSDFEGHPLLCSLGQQGREFQQLLLEQVEFQFQPSSFESSTSDSNLQYLQDDILENRVRPRELTADGTLSIHACHSRLREVQVIKNQILAALESQPDLALRDVLVMAPDIQVYAPFISAEFADIQHAIADRSLRISSLALNILLQFLGLSQSRLGWLSVLNFLEQPLVYANFGLDAGDLQLIRFWVADTQVRWGQSAAHKQALGLPALEQNTWQAALDRLFMGYAMGSDEAFADGVLPYLHIEGTSAQALGGLNDFLQLLFKAADEFKVAKKLADWQISLSDYADKLLGDSYIDRPTILELLSELEALTEFHHYPVTLAVLIAWLEGRMDENKSGHGFLRGQLTFCSMLPMRSIPFQVIVVLGMNDGEFPKIESRPSFDLLSQYPRLGDRSRRADDRYQFLEILLSARRQLILSYIGQSQRDNSEIPPSVILGELLEVLQDSYQLRDLVVRHPLHGFSPRYFGQSGESRLFSYSASDYAVACGLGVEKPEPPVWWQGAIKVEDAETIAIDDLLRFYHHPQRYFFQQQLGLPLPQWRSEVEEREPFAVDTLTAYLVQQQWVSNALHGKALSLQHLQAAGVWPSGALGDCAWQGRQAELEAFLAAIQAINPGMACPALAVDIQIGAYRLIGKLDHRYQNAGLFYHYSSLKSTHFIEAWLQHLLVNSLEMQTTYLQCKDRSLVFQAEKTDQELLVQLINIYLQGRQKPDAFFTDAGFYYVQQKKPDTALAAVLKYMDERISGGFEPEIAQLFAYRDLNRLFGDEFARQCQTFLQPAWSHAHAV